MVRPPIKIAIIGAGFSGSLLALQLLRNSPSTRVFLIERTERIGRGLAYGSDDPHHLLNVRAGNMSAFPDDSAHFLNWLRLCSPSLVEPHSFASRQVFGTYLQTLLRAIVETEHGTNRLVIVPDEAIAIVDTQEGRGVRLALGRTLDADFIVIATGNLPPHDPPSMDEKLASSAVYIRDPWAPDAFQGVRASDDVLLIGTGLTAIDILTKLARRNHRGRIVAVSRRGLAPRAHYEHGPTMTPIPIPARPTLSQLVRLMRTHAEAVGWREAVDGIRQSVQRLWCEASDGERARFLRHLRPWWDVHRHRLAPAVAAEVGAMTASGQLSFHKAKITGFALDDHGATVSWRVRGTERYETIGIDKIVNCTGPAGNPRKARSPLLDDLLDRGLARPDAFNLGLDVDSGCHLIDENGTPHPALLAVGPVSRGAFWETTAVPDIRVQVAQVAQRLVAGEAAA